MAQVFENPFSNAGRIVSGSRFIGRKESLAEIESKVFHSDPANLAIIGGPGMGKSSLVEQAITLYQEKLQEHNLLPIKMDLGHYTNSYDFFYALPKLCLKELEKRGYQLTPQIDRAAEQCRQEESSGRVDFELIQYFFEKVRQSGIRVIFILDEFDQARYLFKDDSSGFPRLRTLSYDSECGVTYITISRRTIYQIELQTGIGSTLDSIFFFKHYLCPFDTEDLQEHFSRLGAIGIPVTETLKKEIATYTGGSPTLLGHLSYEIVEIFRKHQKVDVQGAYKKTSTSFIAYYKRIEKRLREDQSFDKLLQITCGPVMDITQTDVDEFLTYGLIKPGPDNHYAAFSADFHDYLRAIARKTRLWSLLEHTEIALRVTIADTLQRIYHDQWMDVIERKHKAVKDIFARCKKQQKKDLDFFGQASSHILDNTYISDLFTIITLEWETAHFATILKVSKAEWTTRHTFLLNIRNAIAHNKGNIVVKEHHKQQAEIYFKDILNALQSN